MQRKCDLYFCDAVKSSRLKFVELFDKNFVYDNENTYLGYLHADVDRVKLASVVSDLRQNGITCFSVPIDYRDQENISMDTAIGLATEHAKSIGASTVASIGHGQKCPPVFWIFDLLHEKTADEKAGGVIMIDRLDGHWSGSEYEEYLHDYNDVLKCVTS